MGRGPADEKHEPMHEFSFLGGGPAHTRDMRKNKESRVNRVQMHMHEEGEQNEEKKFFKEGAPKDCCGPNSVRRCVQIECWCRYIVWR